MFNAFPSSESSGVVRHTGSPQLEFCEKWPFFANHPRNIDGGEGVSKCVICDVGSIFEVCFVTWNFFPLYGPRYGLRNFRTSSVFVGKHYDHLCLKLNNSKIWRRIAEFFSEIVHNVALYKIYAENPQNVAPFLDRVPLKTRHSTKVAIFEAPLYKLCKGLVFQVRCVFQRV